MSAGSNPESNTNATPDEKVNFNWNVAAMVFIGICILILSVVIGASSPNEAEPVTKKGSKIENPPSATQTEKKEAKTAAEFKDLEQQQLELAREKARIEALKKRNQSESMAIINTSLYAQQCGGGRSFDFASKIGVGEKNYTPFTVGWMDEHMRYEFFTGTPGRSNLFEAATGLKLRRKYIANNPRLGVEKIYLVYGTTVSNDKVAEIAVEVKIEEIHLDNGKTIWRIVEKYPPEEKKFVFAHGIVFIIQKVVNPDNSIVYVVKE